MTPSWANEPIEATSSPTSSNRSSSRPARPGAPRRRRRRGASSRSGARPCRARRGPAARGRSRAPSGRPRGPRPRGAGRPGRGGPGGAGTTRSSRTSPASPSASIETWAPPPVSSTIDSTTSEETPATAPSSRARASLRSSMSTAMTCAPAAVAIITAARPTPPQPWTATHSPARTPACTCSAAQAVMKRQPSDAASTDDNASGTRTRFRSALRQRDELRERAPDREARLDVPLAHLRLAQPARLAHATAAAERHGHAVADREPVHLRADLHDLAAQLVPGHVGQLDRCVVAHPAVPVRAAHAGGEHAHHGAVRRRTTGSSTVSSDRGDSNECMTAARMSLLSPGVL